MKAEAEPKEQTWYDLGEWEMLDQPAPLISQDFTKISTITRRWKHYNIPGIIFQIDVSKFEWDGLKKFRVKVKGEENVSIISGKLGIKGECKLEKIYSPQDQIDLGKFYVNDFDDSLGTDGKKMTIHVEGGRKLRGRYVWALSVLKSKTSGLEHLKENQRISVKFRAERGLDSLEHGIGLNLDKPDIIETRIEKAVKVGREWEDFFNFLKANYVRLGHYWENENDEEIKDEWKMKSEKQKDFPNLSVDGKDGTSPVSPFVFSLLATIGRVTIPGWGELDNIKYHDFPNFDENKKFSDYFEVGKTQLGEIEHSSSLSLETFKEWERIFEEWRIKKQ